MSKRFWVRSKSRGPDSSSMRVRVSVNFGLRSACNTKERNWQQHTIHQGVSSRRYKAGQQLLKMLDAV
jgi:hypothetical protein